jgi:predicted transcriptional regulator
VASRKQDTPPPLHELEAEVMEQVWRHDEVTVREVLEALNRGTKQRAYTTVMTIMSRLDEKSLLERRRQGRADVYRASLTRDQYLAARAEAEVAELVSDYGDVALAHFARQLDTLDARRRAALRKLAEEAE